MIAPFPFRFGGYGTIVADPAWRFDDQAGRMRTEYPTMTDAEILALPVDTLAAERGHLYVWTTDAHLETALACVRRWGFVFKRTIVWIKTLDEPRWLRALASFAADDPTCPEGVLRAVLRFLAKRIGKVKIGGGHTVRGAHELCLLGARDLTGLVRDEPSVILAPHPRDEEGRIVHSAKPEALQDMAERLSPGPRIELFSRRARAGWDHWGNQTETRAAA